MSNTPTALTAQQAVVAAPGCELAAPGCQLAAARPSTLRRWGQRGMVTAEYAVGILAAIAMALVLVRVLNESPVAAALLKQVTALIGQMSAHLK